jgi:uncharacterized membrane protein YqhA
MDESSGGRVEERPRTARQTRALRLARAATFAVVVPVATLLLGALAAFGYAVYTLATALAEVFRTAEVNLTVELVKVVDLILVGVVLVIVAAGLLELFLVRPARSGVAWLPEWLVMTSLDDLKAPVLSMLVLVIVVSFVDDAVSSHDGWFLLGLGAGSAAVIAAIGVYRVLQR